MSNVIEFLERLGSTPQPAAGDSIGYETEVASLAVDDEVRQALMSRDSGALGDLLGGRPKMLCMLFPAEGDDNQKDSEDEDSNSPDDDEKKESATRNGLH
ncbi:hypothetical protein [Arenimonas donghaensis]|uniref:Uncharacterized protein n=1 Tax=Arenimonas donghaensis DSM 18148 = HO3-R19 TaxID=1121014 RepID=A0A087MJ73_9GAMM|nr:hypothetical protein [Arenimonas donghaensis]KFL36926.1 hypothetical protein N788_12420 [Arenimonas donghaensis DSM 18148 = HO3-R19]